jgi:hypothetical protein
MVSRVTGDKPVPGGSWRWGRGGGERRSYYKENKATKIHARKKTQHKSTVTNALLSLFTDSPGDFISKWKKENEITAFFLSFCLFVSTATCTSFAVSNARVTAGMQKRKKKENTHNQSTIQSSS